jgi:hypothetical protein
MDASGAVSAQVTDLVQQLFARDGLPRVVAPPICDVEISAAERELGVTFPDSYRAFLRRFGAARLAHWEIYGIPWDGLRGDVVVRNQLAPRTVPDYLVAVAADDAEHAFFLDTSRMSPQGECPVVAIDRDGQPVPVAASFLSFLRGLGQKN